MVHHTTPEKVACFSCFSTSHVPTVVPCCSSRAVTSCGLRARISLSSAEVWCGHVSRVRALLTWCGVYTVDTTYTTYMTYIHIRHIHTYTTNTTVYSHLARAASSGFVVCRARLAVSFFLFCAWVVCMRQGSYSYRLP